MMSSSTPHFNLIRGSNSQESCFESGVLAKIHLLSLSEAQCIGAAQRLEQSAGRRKQMSAPATVRFREARRIQESFLAALEKKTLYWLAERTPAWINSDHLTLLGLAAMAGAGAAYWWSAHNRLALLLVAACLAINWLGDSLDGTLARYRNCTRPRYGFYVDHIVDAFSALSLLGGLALSGYMSPWVALGLLIAYLLLSIEVYLATYTLGDFKISYFKIGPTELRLLLVAGNLVLLFWKTTCHVMGRSYRLFSVAGTLGISGMMLVLLISVIHNTWRLYRREPLPARASSLPATAALEPACYWQKQSQ
jgi:phosphatidylglycerophosphate synthase